jgi:hypothetical protein
MRVYLALIKSQVIPVKLKNMVHIDLIISKMEPNGKASRFKFLQKQCQNLYKKIL